MLDASGARPRRFVDEVTMLDVRDEEVVAALVVARAGESAHIGGLLACLWKEVMMPVLLSLACGSPRWFCRVWKMELKTVER